VNPPPTSRDRPAASASASASAPPLRTALLLGALIALAPLSIDLYLPALPAITADLGTTASSVQLMLTAMLIGLGLGQLMIGPLSDVWGRRRPLFAGLTLYALASLLVVVTPDVGVLSVLRFLQGMGGAAGTVVALAVVSDLFEGRVAARLLARLMLVMGVSPVLAPSLGSELMVLTSWRGVFGCWSFSACPRRCRCSVGWRRVPGPR
jgi:MFS transporter, DHA1 family, multidrug resistance protein